MYILWVHVGGRKDRHGTQNGIRNDSQMGGRREVVSGLEKKKKEKRKRLYTNAGGAKPTNNYLVKGILMSVKPCINSRFDLLSISRHLKLYKAVPLVP